MKSSIRRYRQRGFSVFEAVIGLAIAAVVVSWAMSVRAVGDDQEDGRTKADLLSSVMQLSSQYVTSNRTAIAAAMVDGTGASTYCRVNVNEDGTGGTTANDTTLHTCAFDTTLLRAQGLWPTGLSVDADGGGRYVVIWRAVYSGGTATGALEGIVVHAQPTGVLTPAAASDMKNLTTKIESGMAALGGSGGYVPIGDMVTCKAQRSSTTYQACGNSWTVSLASFISPAQLTTFANALPD